MRILFNGTLKFLNFETPFRILTKSLQKDLYNLFFYKKQQIVLSVQ